jgi:hypothetical protein
VALRKRRKKIESVEFQMAMKSSKVGTREISFRIYTCILDVISLYSKRYPRKNKEDLFQISLGRFEGPIFNALGKMGRVGISKNSWRMRIKKKKSILKSACNVPQPPW